LNYILQTLEALRAVTPVAVAVRIFAAVIIGGLLGLERGLKNRAAGLRTYMLVCVGACIIMLTNQYIYQTFGSGDPVRMGAQVVSGIGFLGAGTIIVTRRSQIKGLTTAAGLWSSAGLGLALGIGFYEAAIVGAVAIFVIMTLLQRMDDKLHRKNRVLEIYLELSHEISLGDFLRQVRQQEVDISDIQREQDSDAEAGIRAYIALIRIKKRLDHMNITEMLQNIPGVVYVEEL
jgi:putative Mg2+ transporter-C (MgtC) family protein